MSNSKTIINISSSSSDTKPEPNPTAPSKPLKKRRVNPYKNYLKTFKPQRIAIVEISSSEEESEEEESEEESEGEMEEEEEEPIDEWDVEDAIWGCDPKPASSAESCCSRVGPEPAVVSPLPNISQDASFEANCSRSK